MVQWLAQRTQEEMHSEQTEPQQLKQLLTGYTHRTRANSTVRTTLGIDSGISNGSRVGLEPTTNGLTVRCSAN